MIIIVIHSFPLLFPFLSLVDLFLLHDHDESFYSYGKPLRANFRVYYYTVFSIWIYSQSRKEYCRGRRIIRLWEDRYSLVRFYFGWILEKEEKINTKNKNKKKNMKKRLLMIQFISISRNSTSSTNIIAHINANK